MDNFNIELIKSTIADCFIMYNKHSEKYTISINNFNIVASSDNKLKYHFSEFDSLIINMGNFTFLIDIDDINQLSLCDCTTNCIAEFITN